MKGIPLFSRQQIWWPTRWGWLLLLIATLILAGLILEGGESFLTVTHRVPADVLVVEGWIGREAIEAAADEFRNGGYQVVVASGGFTRDDWGRERFSYSEIAARELRRAGVPRERILVAPSPAVNAQRTFASGLSVRETLRSHGMSPKGLNVFTRGAHARRTWLVTHKVEEVPVGVVTWIPDRERGVAWWHSSERTKNLLTEGCAYLFETVLNSGRLSNHPPEMAPPPVAEGPPDGA